MTKHPPPRIEALGPKLLVGMAREMSQASDATGELWRAFRPRIAEVIHRATDEMISMRVYPGSARDVYDADAHFWRWAAVEVSTHDHVPAGMEAYTLEGGSYAVFVHRGPASDVGIFRHIFGEWLPASDFVLAHREHFEVLPAGYDPRDQNATEEIWIPVDPKE
ncbi:MAG: GyrI-like domain-containing protein [Gemmatimonadota bacterium]|jgi:AraC family transcriptional regulator